MKHAQHILNNYFENIFLIAQPGSERYKNFINRWGNLDFIQSKFVNQDNDCLKIENKVEHAFDNIKPSIELKDQLSKGQIAVALAHMLIYDEIIKNKLSNTLILEDDAVFNSDNNLEEALNLDWDILSLFSGFKDGSSISENVNQETKFTRNWDRQGICAYVIRSREIAKYLYDKQSLQMYTADGVICDKNINVLALYPGVCTIDNSPSIIVNGLY